MYKMIVYTKNKKIWIVKKSKNLDFFNHYKNRSNYKIEIFCKNNKIYSEL